MIFFPLLESDVSRHHDTTSYHLCSLSRMWTWLYSAQCLLSFRLKSTAESGPGVFLHPHFPLQWLLYLCNVELWTFITAPGCIIIIIHCTVPLGQRPLLWSEMWWVVVAALSSAALLLTYSVYPGFSFIQVSWKFSHVNWTSLWRLGWNISHATYILKSCEIIFCDTLYK